MPEGDISSQAIDNRERIDPLKTGDNIAAKRVVPYAWDGTDWVRSVSGLFTAPYDEIAFSNPDGNGNYQTLTSKLASSTANIFAITYDASSNITDIKRTT